MTYRTPAQRLGRTANLVIFLGILYALLHLLAVLGLLRGYRLPGLGLVIALGILGLGYGIRHEWCVSVCGDGGICWAEPVFWGAGGVSLEAVPYAASGAQRLDVLASVPCSPADATPATDTGVSTAHESLWRALSASLPAHPATACS